MRKGQLLSCCAIGLIVMLSAVSGRAQMINMANIGPRTEAIKVADYQHLVLVVPTEGKVAVMTSNPIFDSVSKALASITDASATNRYAVLVAAGRYLESEIQMKPHVDLYGGFFKLDPNDPEGRNIFEHASILDGEKKATVVLGADNAQIDGFVITGGENNDHGGGILCKGVSPTITNNIIRENHTSERPGFRKDRSVTIGSDGAGIALLDGSKSLVENNLFYANTSDIGAGVGLMARGGVEARIINNVFVNQTSGVQDDTPRGDQIGSRSSPGAAIACSDASSPMIICNVMAMGDALHKNDAGGVYVEGNSKPLIMGNWLVGNSADDDGGAIYVMGNLAYDKSTGVRSVSVPDGPAVIKSNLIVGNHAITGGPGGIRLSKKGQIVLEGNFVTDGVGSIPGTEIKRDQDNVRGEKKFQLDGAVLNVKFNDPRCVTKIDTDKDLAGEKLAGKVVKIGDQWSVVKSSDAKSLTVWGKIKDSAEKFEVLDLNGWKPKLPANLIGEYPMGRR